MQTPHPPPGIPLQRLTAIAIVASMLLLTLALLLQGQHGLRQALVAAATDDSQRLGSLIGERTQQLLSAARSALSLLRHDALSGADSLAARLPRLSLLAETLQIGPALSAVYIGYPDGDFLLLRRLEQDSDPQRQRLRAPAQARYLLQSIDRDAAGATHGEWHFYDSQLQLLERQIRPDYRYDPRSRPWYRQAMADTEAILTPPYLFFTTAQIGVSLAQRSLDGRMVIGMDAAVQDLSSQVRALRLTPGTLIAALDAQDQVFIHSEPQRLLIGDDPASAHLAKLDELQAPALSALQRLPADGRQVQAFSVEGHRWYGVRMPLTGLDSASKLLIAIPEAELFLAARQLLLDKTLLAGLLLVPMLLAGWWLGRRIGTPLRELARHLEALIDFDFRQPPQIRSRIREVGRLGWVLQRMAGSLYNLQTITHTLNRESRLELMLEQVLQQLVGATALEGGGIYLYESDNACLRLNTRHLAGDYPPSLDCSGEDAVRLDADLVQLFAARDYLCIPLKDRSDALLGLLVLRLGELHREPRAQQSFRRFAEEIAGAAAVAIETRQLIESQQRLIDAIIRLLADAIDAKSPYTGGHCERVPQLAILLVEKAIACREGSFADFRMSEAELYEFRIAAWLHDCGKITSPEHVVDKATKLETLYNRLHEIRTRFEVLWRDAELDYWRALADGGDGDGTALQRQLQRRQDELQEDFAFVARCNIGGEDMDDEDIRRLERIAERRWWRHFDDRLGLSLEERQRLEGIAPRALPAEERLLADRPEHRQPWGSQRPPVEKDDPRNRWGFDMRLPPHAADRGELHNLRTRRGTLTDEERFKINEHIVQTLIMLSSLPLPPHLRKVPDIAANHHEKMDGSGYPRRLRREQLSLPERIVAVADIFEALTAHDRPYKPPKPLSEALQIMARMAREAHIDSEVFRLFLCSGAYLEYAQRFLAAGQIDAVDLDACLRDLPMATEAMPVRDAVAGSMPR